MQDENASCKQALLSAARIAQAAKSLQIKSQVRNRT